ncbi:MAG: hydrogenase expression/formation protein HypE [Spirochaetota bacterium]|nr:hydrogenase expression/formation protein HypE [Spirochaetota bacterium]
MDHTNIQLAHGAGGKLSAELLEKLILPRFTNEILDSLEDQATLTIGESRISFTTDSFVVSPLFFPGGDIGKLSIYGTVNDLAMGGGIPRYISVSFVIEEGFAIAELHRVLLSMEEAAKKAGVLIVTGDTKVVDRGSCDRLFITTSGIGIVAPDRNPGIRRLCVGDKILLSGSIGDHGMAILTSRENLSFESRIESDCAPLNGLVEAMYQVCPDIHTLRDPTRGGLAASVNEWAKSAQVGVQLYEKDIPMRSDVRGAGELLGIDPLYVANEGKLVAAVPESVADEVLEAMRAHEYGRDASVIGEITAEHPGMVVMKTALGVNRIVDMPLGEQLPRIC